jgi:hypothetical protein
MAIHTQRTQAADTMSYANYPKFFEILKGDLTAVQMEKKQIIRQFSSPVGETPNITYFLKPRSGGRK